MSISIAASIAPEKGSVLVSTSPMSMCSVKSRPEVWSIPSRRKCHFQPLTARAGACIEINNLDMLITTLHDLSYTILVSLTSSFECRYVPKKRFEHGGAIAHCRK